MRPEPKHGNASFVAMLLGRPDHFANLSDYWSVTYQVPRERLRDTTSSYDTLQPPVLLNSAAKFSAARLRQPPVIDGREWLPTDVHTTFFSGQSRAAYASDFSYS